jgi:cell division protein FtsW (lipid II flippase)
MPIIGVALPLISFGGCAANEYDGLEMVQIVHARTKRYTFEEAEVD